MSTGFLKVLKSVKFKLKDCCIYPVTADWLSLTPQMPLVNPLSVFDDLGIRLHIYLCLEWLWCSSLSYIQKYLKKNKKQAHTLAQTGNSKSPFNLTCLSWDCGEKPGHRKVTTADTGRRPKSNYKNKNYLKVKCKAGVLSSVYIMSNVTRVDRRVSVVFYSALKKVCPLVSSIPDQPIKFPLEIYSFQRFHCQGGYGNIPNNTNNFQTCFFAPVSSSHQRWTK